MNKLDALRIFCDAAQTRNFRQTAQSLGISPQGVSRAIAFLEQEFGEALFVRNTRSNDITPFGEQVHAHAQQALSHTDDLFQRFSLSERTLEAGLVRVDVPDVEEFALLPAVLDALRDYPAITLDWRSDNRYSNTDREQIDVGVRVGEIAENGFIIKAISPLRMQMVMAPALIERLGKPKNLADLQARFPLATLINSNSGKPFAWDSKSGEFHPRNPVFSGRNHRDILQTVLHGRAVGQFADWSIRHHIAEGHLQTILPKEEFVDKSWQLYVYRPERHRHTARVKRVFDALVAALQNATGK